VHYIKPEQMAFLARHKITPVKLPENLTVNYDGVISSIILMDR